MKEMTREFLRLTRSDSVLADKLIEHLIAPFVVGLGGNLPAEAREAADFARKAFGDAVPSLLDLWAGVYERAFNDDDLRILVDFYSTETGQKKVAIDEGISKDLEQASDAWLQDVMKKNEVEFARILGTGDQDFIPTAAVSGAKVFDVTDDK